MAPNSIDPYDVRTYWNCIPEPEQATLRLLADFAATPLQIVPHATIAEALEIAGGTPSSERASVLMDYPGMTAIGNDGIDCTDDNGCLVLALSNPVIDTLACILVFGCQVDAPSAEPCWYSLTRPNT